MKRLLYVFLTVCCLLTIVGCRETKISEDATVTLHFCCYENDIVQELTAEESARVIEILNGNTYDPYDSRKFELYIDREKYDRVLAHSPEYIKGHPTEDLLATSFSMGHSRIDVLWSYLR